MSLRAPQLSSPKAQVRALDYEIAQEQAAALGRLGRALEAALAALVDYDRTHANALLCAASRKDLVRRAGYRLWCFIVQREACGLRDQQVIMREYNVPREVQNHMGVLTAEPCRTPSKKP